MFKFKVGDKVVVSKGRENYTSSNIGEVRVVTKVEEDFFDCKSENEDGENYCCNYDNWTLLSPSSPEVSYHVLNSSIVLNYSGKTVTIANEDTRFEDVLNCIREDRLQDIPEVVEIERAFTGSGLNLKDGIVYIDNEPLPTELSGRILKFKDLKLPFQPLLNFWENLKQNPSYNSRQMLFKFLENNGHPLTPDGYFIAYRGVTDDFKDVHTKTFDNKVGSVCEMPREQVDDNPNNTCSRGLHVACLSYAKGFGSKTVIVKVNPKDVVTVPTDYNGTKMRVCRFEVVAESDQLIEKEVYQENTEEELEDDLSYFDNNDSWEDDDSWEG